MPGLTKAVQAVISYDDGTGPALYIGIMGGTTDLQYVKRWSPATQTWVNVGSGSWSSYYWCPGGTSAPASGVYAFTVFDPDADGPAAPVLVAGGQFDEAPGVTTTGVATWNGSNWAALGLGYQYLVTTLASGPDIATGQPTIFGGGSVDCPPVGQCCWFSSGLIFQWHDQSWTTIYSIGSQGGATYYQHGVAVFDDDGSGLRPPRLFAMDPMAEIAYWTGSSWVEPAGGASGTIYDAVSFDDGTGPALYVVGNFYLAGDIPVANVAKLSLGPRCAPDVSPIGGDGTVNVADLVFIINNWGAAGGPADITLNGMVNASDLLAVINGWGVCP